jgi:hypothetical protein
MVWLIEFFQLGRAEKWSGTNQHPNHFQNKLGNILNSHFCSFRFVVFSNATLVFSFDFYPVCQSEGTAHLVPVYNYGGTTM